jgi:hypothetical protein
MWAPRRLARLVLGLVLGLVAYFGYASSFFGAIDGLPALPERYYPGDGEPTAPPVRRNTVDEKIAQSFGKDCEELKRPYRVELRTQNIVLSAGDFQTTEDGRVRLQPVSLAHYGKRPVDGVWPEINTVRGKIAYLTFDRPIQNIQEVGGRKLTRAELSGNIEIVNNRRTEDRSDDLCVYIANGPLFYDEAQHLIWTEDAVYLKDQQSKPKPIEVRGKGMTVELIAEAPPPPRPGAPARAANRKKNDNITGVKSVVLHRDVLMHLYAEAGSGFPVGAGGAGDRKPAPPAADDEEKSQVTIHTPGRFTYNLGKDAREPDTACFEVPAPDPNDPPRMARDVTVTRVHPRLRTADQIVCQRLDLRLRRKDQSANAKPAKGAKGGKEVKEARPAREAKPGDASTDRGLEIEWARATGKEVILTSDAEKLEAHGDEFVYDNKAFTTTLRGTPEMEAIKENSTLHARELVIVEHKPERGAPPDARSTFDTRALADPARPGRIDMADARTGKKTQHAVFAESMVSRRDGAQDLLIFTGAARLWDDEQGQTLAGDELKIWLDPAPVTEWRWPVCGVEVDGDAGAALFGPPPARKADRKPHHLVAIGNVSAKSKDMTVHDTSRLVVWFKDPITLTFQADALAPVVQAPAQPPQQAGPQPAPQPAVGPAPARPPDAPQVAAAPDMLTKPAPTGPAASAKVGEAEETPARPIDLSAHSVEAWVWRTEPKNTPEKVWCEGAVHVVQEPARPDEKGTDIKGETLSLLYRVEGHFLVVKGDLAQLRQDKIYILGPEVNIDQKENKAWVNGLGAMQMESANSFSGERLSKPVPLTVHWSESMLFNGKFAEFHGGIQAEQDSGRMACQALQVFFDRPISLKEGNKGEQAPKVQHMICDRQVRIEDMKAEGKKLLEYKWLAGQAFTMNALEPEPGRRADPKGEGNEMKTSGPGAVKIYQKGGAAEQTQPAPRPGAGPKPAPRKEGDTEPKLTFVTFRNHMYANNHTNTAIFWGGVRMLIDLPCADPTQDFDMDALTAALPPQALYLAAAQVTVVDHAEKGQPPNREMRAVGRVQLQARDYWGNAVVVTYDEEHDRIILDGAGQGLATLYRVEVIGQKPVEVRGKKIKVIRTTGDFQVEGGDRFGSR